MKAVVYTDERKVEVQDVENPKIEDPRDIVLRVTSTAICGSDLHMYDGHSTMARGRVFGHEIMGVIEEAGAAVTSLVKGDRVVLPFNISCGFCHNCVVGNTSACLMTNPEKAGGSYGYAEMGPHKGGQAEMVRVPHGEFNCIKLPGKPHDELEEDFLLISDIFPTGYHGTELACVEPGSTVAIYGAGPVGLLAAHSALIKGAAEVYVVDRSKVRLAKAAEIGATPMDFTEGDPADQIKNKRRSNQLIVDSYRPGEFEKMPGVMCGIDAVGYQALDFDNPDKNNTLAVLDNLAEVVNPGGHIGVVGVYPKMDPKNEDKMIKIGKYPFAYGKMWDKGISIAGSQTPVKKYASHLKNLVISRKAKPSIIVSHRIDIAEAPDAYKKFDKRGMDEGEDYTKIVIKFKV